MPNVENYKKIFISEQNQFGKGWAQVWPEFNPLFSRECVFAKEIMPQGMEGWKIKNVSNIFDFGAVEEDGTGVAVRVTGLLCGHLYIWVFVFEIVKSFKF